MGGGGKPGGGVNRGEGFNHQSPKPISLPINNPPRSNLSGRMAPVANWLGGEI